MSFRVHSWEQPGGVNPNAGAPLHSWEQPPNPPMAPEEWEIIDDVDGFGGACSDSDEDEPTRPGLELVSYCTDLLHQRTLNANQFCIIMHWAFESGVGEAEQYAKAPGAPSGHYQRHLDRIDGFSSSYNEFYTIQVPSRKSTDLQRSVHAMQAFVPTETLEEEVADNSSFRVRLREMVEDPKRASASVLATPCRGCSWN